MRIVEAGSWMARGRSTILLVVLAAGCKPKTTDVQVDLASLLVKESPRIAASPVIPNPPPPLAPSTQRVPARPRTTVQDPSHASPGDLRASIERSQEQAMRELERRLRAVYRDQTATFALEQERQVEKARTAAFDAANEKIRAVFERYGAARAPLVTRLAVLVGFPDPNPASEPPKRRLKPIAQTRFDEAKRIRAELATLESGFQGEVATILHGVTDVTAEAEAQMRVRVEQFRSALDRQAAAEAEAQVRTSVKELGLSLTDPTPLVLPETPSRVVQIPGEAPLMPAPKVPSEGIPDGPEDRRRLMERQLRIWLGLNRYRLAKGGRDATMEFERWRQTYRAGL